MLPAYCSPVLSAADGKLRCGLRWEPAGCAWFANFDRNWQASPTLRARFAPDADRFYRTWKFYLLACAGTFRARVNHLWHFVLSKRGVVGGYQAVR